MNTTKRLLAAAAASAMLAACSQGNSAPPVVTTVSPGSPSQSKLQLAVGTANFGGGVTGLNVVSTLRQPNGKSAVLLDSPALSGSFSLAGFTTAGGAGNPDAYATITSGAPSTMDIAANALTSTPQTVHPGAPACATVAACPPGVTPNVTTFGQSGGVFAMGLQPANSTTNGVPFTFSPYPVPLFANLSAADAFLPWGGPPAFDPNGDGMGLRDGSFDLADLQGVFMGITPIELPTASLKTGQFQLNVTVPTGLNNQGQSSFATLSANATLGSTAVLPDVTAPTLTEDANGGGTLTATLPAGATEGYLQIVDWGPGGSPANGNTPNCQGALGTAAFPVYYTILVKPGTTTYTLPDTDGPNTTTTKGPGTKTPSMTLCTAAANSATLGSAAPGDGYTVQFIAVDYPLYEATPPLNTSQTPTIAGANGQSDITISPVVLKTAY